MAWNHISKYIEVFSCFVVVLSYFIYCFHFSFFLLLDRIPSAVTVKTLVFFLSTSVISTIMDSSVHQAVFSFLVDFDDGSFSVS